MDFKEIKTWIENEADEEQINEILSAANARTQGFQKKKNKGSGLMLNKA